MNARIHMRPEYAKRLAAEKKAGGSGWDTIKWKQNLYETMNIEIARSNYAMLMERTYGAHLAADGGLSLTRPIPSSPTRPGGAAADLWQSGRALPCDLCLCNGVAL